MLKRIVFAVSGLIAVLVVALSVALLSGENQVQAQQQEAQVRQAWGFHFQLLDRAWSQDCDQARWKIRSGVA